MAYRGVRPSVAMTGAGNDRGNRGSADRSRWRGTTDATAVRWHGFGPRTRSTGGRWSRFARRPSRAPGGWIHCRAGCPTKDDPEPGHGEPAGPPVSPAAAGAGLPAAPRHEAAPDEKVRQAEEVNLGPRPVPFPPAANLRDWYRLAAPQTAAHRSRHRLAAAREPAHSPEWEAPPCRPRRRQPRVAARRAPRPASPAPLRPADASLPRCGAAS